MGLKLRVSACPRIATKAIWQTNGGIQAAVVLSHRIRLQRLRRRCSEAGAQRGVLIARYTLYLYVGAADSVAYRFRSGA